MNGEPGQLLRDSARYLRLLHSVERAHSLGDEESLVSLFAGVDPIDVWSLASALEVLALSIEGSGAEPQAAPPASDATPLPRPSAPVVSITHAGDNWSKRV